MQNLEFSPIPETLDFLSFTPNLEVDRLEAEAVTDPAALLSLADLALDGHLEARERLLNLKFDFDAYQRAFLENPNYLPILAVLPELGCGNVQRLLTAAVAVGPENFFFIMAGVAAEGSVAAYSLLNEVATFDQLAALIGFAEQYGDDPFYGPMLFQVLRSEEFFPKILEAASTGHLTAGAFVSRLSELGNPAAQEWMQVPMAVNWN